MSTKNNQQDSCAFVILGQPYSKANSRRQVRNKRTGKPMFIKSDEAREYADSFAMQCPQLHPPMDGDVGVTIRIFYRDRRPDLDESLILDCMQSVVHIDKKTKHRTVLSNNIYHNDRQVREKHIYWGIDPANPRAEITVWKLEEPE